MEIWKDIIGYEGLYQVSNMGRVKSIPRWIDTKWKSKRYTKEKIMSTTITQRGYELVVLTKDKKKSAFTVHRLLAIAFIKNIKNKEQVNHKDGNKLNNTISNLEWVTHSENIKHAFATGLKFPSNQYM